MRTKSHSKRVVETGYHAQHVLFAVQIVSLRVQDRNTRILPGLGDTVGTAAVAAFGGLAGGPRQHVERIRIEDAARHRLASPPYRARPPPRDDVAPISRIDPL